jgi:hypothetical protein
VCVRRRVSVHVWGCACPPSDSTSQSNRQPWPQISQDTHSKLDASRRQGVGFWTRTVLRRLDHGSHGQGLLADTVCRGLGPTAIHSASRTSATCSTGVDAFRWFRFRVAQICGDSRPIWFHKLGLSLIYDLHRRTGIHVLYNVYKHTCIHACMHTCIHADLHICIPACMHTHAHRVFLLSVCVYINVFVVRPYVYTHIQIYIYI